MPLPEDTTFVVDAPPEGPIWHTRTHLGIRSILSRKLPSGNRQVAIGVSEPWLPVRDVAFDRADAKTDPGKDAVLLIDSLDTVQKRIGGHDGSVGGWPIPVVARIERDVVAAGGSYSCSEYTKAADPGTAYVQCIAAGYDHAIPQRLLALETYNERELRTLVSQDDQDRVSAYVKEVVDSIPDRLYHKCSAETFFESLRRKRYAKLDQSVRSDKPEVVKSRVMSTSAQYLPPLSLDTPAIRHQITLKIRRPLNACPIRVIYTTPAWYRNTELRTGGTIAYSTPREAVMDALYSIEMMQELHARHPDVCSAVGQRDIESRGKIHDSYAHEQEILLMSGDGEAIRFDPDTIEEIILDDECLPDDGRSVRWTPDLFKDSLRERGFPELADRVVESEFCQMASQIGRDVMAAELAARREARSESPPSLWNKEWWEA